jgi:hypothetical protein
LRMVQFTIRLLVHEALESAQSCFDAIPASTFPVARGCSGPTPLPQPSPVEASQEPKRRKTGARDHPARPGPVRLEKVSIARNEEEEV